MIDASVGAANDYGPLVGVVGTVGSLIAAGIAILTAWTRGANWLPPEDDVPNGPARVAGLLISVLVAAMWYEAGRLTTAQGLVVIAISSGITTFVTLLLYIFLMSAYVYKMDIAIADDRTRTRRIVGGFWLTPAARAEYSKGFPVQELITGCGGIIDRVWPPQSRGLAKVAFAGTFIVLQISGCVAISAVSLAIDLAKKAGP